MNLALSSTAYAPKHAITLPLAKTLQLALLTGRPSLLQILILATLP